MEGAGGWGRHEPKPRGGGKGWGDGMGWRGGAGADEDGEREQGAAGVEAEGRLVGEDYDKRANGAWTPITRPRTRLSPPALPADVRLLSQLSSTSDHHLSLHTMSLFLSPPSAPAACP